MHFEIQINKRLFFIRMDQFSYFLKMVKIVIFIIFTQELKQSLQEFSTMKIKVRFTIINKITLKFGIFIVLH